MTPRVDLNADLGEGAGHDLELLTLISSASVACGGHAGDEASITATLAASQAQGVAVGAHPSFPDRENFGRTEKTLSEEAFRVALREQMKLFHRVAGRMGIRPVHVKPHGALYNMAARDRTLAEWFVGTVIGFDSTLRLFAPAGSELARAAERRGMPVMREFFADRNYLASGALVPRGHPEALLHDPTIAAARVLNALASGRVRTLGGTETPMPIDTICIHGDSPQAVAFARELRQKLAAGGASITAS